MAAIPRGLESAPAQARTNPEASVAPDFPTPAAQFNSLVIRPEYRISLRPGFIDDLCRHEPNTPEGRMERLQILGWFYFPLGHRKARVRDADPSNDAYTVAWNWVRDRVMDPSQHLTEAAADAEIQRRLERGVLVGGTLPRAARDGAAPTNTNFRKLRWPGAYTYFDGANNEFPNPNRDPAYNLGFGRDLYAIESLYLRDNPALHKIPLVVHVERRLTPRSRWEPAPNAMVYFQLITPYNLPAFAPGTGFTAQFNRPPLRGSTVGPPAAAAGMGPRRRIDAQEARNPNATDPQVNNCHDDRGGKRGRGNFASGTDVANVIFSTRSTPGFNAAHTAPVARRLQHDPYPVPEAVANNGADHVHAVRARTNAQGDAGVIFMPSRCGGDRYRIRVYLGPPTIPSNGADATAVRVDTGTFVVWRQMRISRYVQMPNNAPAAELVRAGAQWPYNLTDMSAPPVRSNSEMYRAAAFVIRIPPTPAAPPGGPAPAPPAIQNVGMADASLDRTGNSHTGGTAFDGIRQQFAKAFCEITPDKPGNFPEPMTQTDWADAMDACITAATPRRASLGLANLDLRVLLYREAGSPINVNNAMCLIPMRTVEDYNTNRGAGAPALPLRASIGGGPTNNLATRIDNLFSLILLPAFQFSLSRRGLIPGIVMTQGPGGSTWQMFGNPPGGVGISNFSGISTHFRGALVWWGNRFYASAIGTGGFYDLTSNWIHELGHALYRDHAPGGGTGGAVAAEHDPVAHTFCVMSYQRCEGQFCGRCLLAFRGWNARLA